MKIFLVVPLIIILAFLVVTLMCSVVYDLCSKYFRKYRLGVMASLRFLLRSYFRRFCMTLHLFSLIVRVPLVLFLKYRNNVRQRKWLKSHEWRKERIL